jgi:hypothetical protein
MVLLRRLCKDGENANRCPAARRLLAIRRAMLIIQLAWGAPGSPSAEGKRAVFRTIDGAAEAPGSAAVSRRG